MTIQDHDSEWRAVLDGDKAAFRRLVEPYVAELLTAAQREIAHQRREGTVPSDALTPYELVGETLLEAWQDRFRRKAGVGLRAWLLRTQWRLTHRLVMRWRLEQHLQMLSLEEPVAETAFEDQDADLEAVWPDAVAPVWLEDILPAGLGLAEGGAAPSEQAGLESLARCVMVLHDRHQVPLEEVAEAIHVPTTMARSLLEWARNESDAQEVEPE
jgi:DNA-directed RNA polymerase specialized sigma24 family protein